MWYKEYGWKTNPFIIKPSPNIINFESEKEKLLTDFSELKQFEDSPNIPASFLIDRAGLKGQRVGHVAISPRHANFFINEGGASADEVRALIRIAYDAVQKKFGISLEEEIQYVGF